MLLFFFKFQIFRMNFRNEKKNYVSFASMLLDYFLYVHILDSISNCFLSAWRKLFSKFCSVDMLSTDPLRNSI